MVPAGERIPTMALWVVVRSFTAAAVLRGEPHIIHSLAHQTTELQVYVSISRRAVMPAGQKTGGGWQTLVARYAH